MRLRRFNSRRSVPEYSAQLDKLAMHINLWSIADKSLPVLSALSKALLCSPLQYLDMLSRQIFYYLSTFLLAQGGLRTIFYACIHTAVQLAQLLKH